MVSIQKDKRYTIREFFVLLVDEGRLPATPMVEKALCSLEKSGGGESPAVAELSETTIELWIDDIITKLSLSSVTRYVESIQRIYKYALKYGLATNEQVFVRAKKYIDLVSGEGGDNIAKQKVDVVRRVACVARLGKGETSVAVDACLYSFFNAGMAIEDVVALRFEDEEAGGTMPHVARIVEKYRAPKRRYVFPLQQSQRTVNKIKEEIDRELRAALKSYNFCFEDKTAQDFTVSAWISAAKACGISADDICACCKGAANYPRFKDIQPSDLSQKQIEAIKKKVANSIVDMDCHWYAVRFAGDFETLRDAITELTVKSYVKTYYPMNKICRRKNGRIKSEERAVIRNVMFLYTMPRVLVNILNSEVASMSRLRVFTSSPLRRDDYVIIPNAQMKRFSMLVSNGVAIFAEDAIKQSQIEAGSSVQINDGPFEGYCGRVIKVRVDNDKHVTMLQIKAEIFGKEMEQALGQHLYITIAEDLVCKIEKKGRGA